MLWRIGSLLAVLIAVSGCDVQSPTFNPQLLKIDVCAKRNVGDLCPDAGALCPTANAEVLAGCEPDGCKVEFCAVGTFAGLFNDSVSIPQSRRDITNEVSWVSQNAASAAVSPGDPPNRFTGLAPDNSVRITARRSGVQGSTLLRVKEANLESVEVFPPAEVLVEGLLPDYSCVARFDTGTSPDVTAQALWNSSDPGVVEIGNEAGNKGRARIGVPGTSTIRCTLTVNNVTEFDLENSRVIDATLDRLIVTANSNDALLVPATRQYRAIGDFISSDSRCSPGCTIDLSNSANWASGDRAVITVNNVVYSSRGLVTAVAAGMTEVFASFRGLTASAPVQVGGGGMSDIGLTISGPTQVLQGFAAQLTATATIIDADTGEEVTQDVTTDEGISWTSSDPASATIPDNDGRVLAAAEPVSSPVLITAEWNGQTATHTLEIVPAVLTGLSMSPNAGCIANSVSPSAGTLQINAYGLFELSGQQCTEIVTELAEWSSTTGASDGAGGCGEGDFPGAVGDPPVVVDNTPGSKGLAMANQDAQIPGGATGEACIAVTVSGTSFVDTGTFIAVPLSELLCPISDDSGGAPATLCSELAPADEGAAEEGGR